MLDTDLCWCGSNKAYKDCHKQFDEHLNSIKLKAFKGQKRPPRNIIKNEKDIEGIRKSGIINNGALDLIASKICAGMDTETINLLAHNYIVEHGGIPACLNYEGYPKSICVSINNVVCHGIPSRDIVLKDGDIVNVDVTTILDGYYADASRMFMIGNVSNKARKLVEVTKECMEIGIKAIKPWSFVGDIGAVVEHHAHKHGYSVVEDLVRMNIISEEYEEVKPFKENYAAIKKDNLWGYIDTTFQVKIPCKYDNCSSFKKGLASFEIKREALMIEGYINKRGEVVWQKEYSNWD